MWISPSKSVAVLLTAALFAAGGALALTAADYHEAKAPPAVRDNDDSWTLELRFKDPRVIRIGTSDKDHKDVWYLVYQISNPTGAAHTVTPEMDLVTGGNDVHHDKVPSRAVLDAIRDAEDAKGAVSIKTAATIAAEPITPTKPGAALTTGVATWDDVAPDCDHFIIFVGGLSSRVSVDDQGKVNHKMLQLNFRRARGENEMRRAGPPQWIYRQSTGTTGATREQTDELLRTIAKLRKELKETKAVADIVYKDKALAKATRETALLREQLTAKQIEAENLRARCQKLEQRVDEMDSEKKKDKLAEPPAVEGPSVEGLVTQVGAGVALLNIGKDVGVVKGQMFQVYRLNTKEPEKSRYLGRMRIIEVNEKGSVGQLMGKAPAPLEEGDKVVSRRLDK